MYIIDEYENEWTLRNFVANVLLWFFTDNFSVVNLSYTEYFSIYKYNWCNYSPN